MCVMIEMGADNYDIRTGMVAAAAIDGNDRCISRLRETHGP